MTSTILSFFKLFGTRASRTTTNPNSRAAVNLWRRFFELKKQEEEDHLEDISRALEDLGFNSAARPAVQSETAVYSRAESLRDHYRKLIGDRNRRSVMLQVSSNNNSSNYNTSDNYRGNENRLTMPNRAVLTGNRLDADYIYLPQ